MFEGLKSKFRSVAFSAAILLPPVPVPKTRPGQTAIPSFLRQATPDPNSNLQRRDRRLASTDITTLRLGTNSQQVIRDFVAASPDLAMAVSTYIRIGIPNHFKIKAYNMDGTFNVDATNLAHQILTRMDILGNYEDGFSGIWSLRSTSEALAKELIMFGACSAELVLDKARLPRGFVPISTRDIRFRPDNQWTKPIQDIGGQEVDLDIPTFFYCSIDQDLKEPYADSPLEAAIQPVLADQEFQNDLRRVLKRAIHPRLDVSINLEMLKKSMPAEYLHDPQKFKEYLDRVIADVEAQVNGLRPEDALVHYDFVTLEYKNNGSDSTSDNYEILQKIVNAKLATGARSLPSILGHGSGSQNIASSETLLFIKNADGLVRSKLNEIYSKAFTLAVRLFGQDAYVKFEYDPIDLRPEVELEAFRSMKNSRILDLLSLGMITDEEAAIELTGKLPGATYKPLSGTYFRQAGAGGFNPNNNPFSTTSTGGNGGGAAVESTAPDTPQQPQGAPNQNASMTMDFNLMAMNRTVGNAIDATGSLASQLVDSNKEVVKLMRDQTYVLSQQTQKPVHVQVDSAPVELNLSIEQKQGKKQKKIELVRDADGYVTHANVVEDDEVGA